MNSRSDVKPQRGLSTGVVLQHQIDFGVDPSKPAVSPYDQRQHGCLTLWKYQFARNGTKKKVNSKPAQKSITKTAPKAMSSWNPKDITKSKPKSAPKPLIKQIPKVPPKLATKAIAKPVQKVASIFQPGKHVKEMANPLPKIPAVKKADEKATFFTALKDIPKPAPKDMSRVPAKQEKPSTLPNYRAMMQTLTKDRQVVRLSGGSGNKPLPAAIKSNSKKGIMNEEAEMRAVLKRLAPCSSLSSLDLHGVWRYTVFTPEHLLVKLISLANAQEKIRPGSEGGSIVRDFHEVMRVLADKTKKPKLFIIACDCIKGTPENGVNEAIQSIKNYCYKHEVPCIYGLTRRQLADAVQQKRPLNCLALLHFEAVADAIDEFLQKLGLRCSIVETNTPNKYRPLIIKLAGLESA